MKFIKLMIGGLLVLISEQLARSFVFTNKPLSGICPTFSHLTQSSMLFAENRTVRHSKAKHFFCSIILVCQFSLSNKRLQSLFTIISTSNANIHYNCLIIAQIRKRNLSKCMYHIHKKRNHAFNMSHRLDNKTKYDQNCNIRHQHIDRCNKLFDPYLYFSMRILEVKMGILIFTQDGYTEKII